MTDTPQQSLLNAARRRGLALSALSRMLGRNQAYLGQFVHRGSPRVLPERERGLLADLLGVDEVTLGAAVREEAEVTVPWLAVAAAAGSGRVAEREEVLRREPVSRAMLRAAGIAPGDASIVAVAGESMAPTLLDGDRLIVDGADRRPAGGAIYVIRRDGEVAVKRLYVTAAGWRIVSDNPDWPEVLAEPDAVAVVGRARLLMRGL